eukprot:symbB.v1.2.011846.t1/scaffold801.1/size161289/2
MFKINVALPNGHAELLTLQPSSTLQELQTAAQQAFGKKYLKLITAKNRVLVNFEQTIEEAEIEDGECLTALVLQPQLAATNGAFALWCHGDSTIVTWGLAAFGGESSAVQDQLRGVQQIQATYTAFAAILEDGSVVTWGKAKYGGDNGSVVTWGNARFGGDSSAVRDQLKGAQQIQATRRAFAAILEDESVVTWGDASRGGDSSAVQDQLKGVQQIQASHGAFAAILEDGSIVTWGDADYGGDSSAVRDQLRDVKQIQATQEAFAAILEDGSVVTWGAAAFGGLACQRKEKLQSYDISVKNCWNFEKPFWWLARRLCGCPLDFCSNAPPPVTAMPSPREWQEHALQQGLAAQVPAKQVLGKKYLKLITAKNRVLVDFEQTLEEAEIEDGECLTALVLQPQLAATRHAFALWCHGDSTIVTWGHADYGADSSAVQDQLKGVVQIQATYRAFAAILEDGSILTWGDADFGGDSSAVRDQLRGVQQIQATSGGAFAAIREDGSVAQKDLKGQTPMSLLAKHLTSRGGVPQLPEPVAKPQLPMAPMGSETTTVDVEDEATNKVMSLIFKTSLLQLSQRFKMELRAKPDKLKVAPECCRSARVVQEVFTLLSSDSNQQRPLDGRELWQLLSFCVQYQLPTELKSYASDRVLRCIQDETNIAVLPMLLRGAQACGLTSSQRRYVLHCMLTSPAALASAGWEISVENGKPCTVFRNFKQFPHDFRD